MRKKILPLLLVFSFLLITPLAPEAQSVQAQAGSAYDLIAAVNALRAQQGLTALEVDPILMSIAQGHSDYQASVGYWTHEGPGGSRPRDRAMSAGFGGGATVYVSENVAVLNTSASFSTLIYSIWSDAIHWNTMTSSSYTHAGAGVTVSGDEVYYTLDVGYIAGSPGGYVPGATYTAGSSYSAPTQATSDVISPVVTSTPRTDGSVYHTVQQGQSMWSIAIAYEMTIKEIAEMNGLDFENPSIWAGVELLIQPSLQPSATSPLTNTPLPETRTPRPSTTPRLPTITPTATQVGTPTSEPFIKLPSLKKMDHGTLGIVVIAVCSLGLLAVILTGFRRSKS